MMCRNSGPGAGMIWFQRTYLQCCSLCIVVLSNLFIMLATPRLVLIFRICSRNLGSSFSEDNARVNCGCANLVTMELFV
jgi:hypothetical protein